MPPDASQRPGTSRSNRHIRRELGFLPGVAANLVRLAHIAAGDGRTTDAATLLEEAGVMANNSGAGGITRQVAEARTHLVS